MIKKFIKNSEKGQAIIMIAFGLMSLIAIVGLMTDGGMMLIEYARLKRGIDAASVAAAQQFRKSLDTSSCPQSTALGIHYDVCQIKLASENFLRLNQSDVSAVQIDTCETAPSDTSLCTTPARKLVRVTATRTITFGFMRVVGFESTDITATSIGEAASVDLVLMLDTSGSMAFETSGDPRISDPGAPGDDPRICNLNNNCQPMENIKSVARDFMDTLFFPYDRVAIVASTSQQPAGYRDPQPVLHLSDNETLVRQSIAGVKVFEPQSCDSGYGPCLRRCSLLETQNSANANCYLKPENYFLGSLCPAYADINTRASCTSSNIGGAIKMAGEEFAYTDATHNMKQDSFWVVIALVGGATNATNFKNDHSVDADHDGIPDEFGWCPDYTLTSAGDPLCRNASFSYSMSMYKNADGTFPDDYDAVSYARDQADFLANPVTGTGVTIFTIGLGDLLIHANLGDPDAGEQLLEYIAESAGDTVNAAGLLVKANHGFYRFAPTTSELAGIFAAIAENIKTRISQ